MSKRKRLRHDFVEPPPIVFSDIPTESPAAKLLDVYQAAVRRAQAYLANPKFQRLATHFRRCTGLALSAASDHCFARADALHFQAMAEAFDAGAELGADRYLIMLITEDLQAEWEIINLARFDSYSRFVFFLKGENDPTALRYVQSHIEALGEAVASFSAKYPEDLADLARAIVQRWLACFSEPDIPLLNLFPEEDVMDAVLNPDFSPDDLRAQSAMRIAALGPLAEQARVHTAQWRSLMSRMESNVHRLWEDYDLLEPKPTDQQIPNVHWILALAKKSISARMMGSPDGIDDSLSSYCFKISMIFDLSTSEWFWLILLYQMLAQSGGVEQGRLASWTYPLLDNLLRHPGRLMRQPVDPPGEKARTQLSRNIAPLLRGSDAAGSQDFLDLAAGQQARDAHYLLAVARQIVRRFLIRTLRKLGAHELPLDPEQIDAISNLWRTHFSPYASRIADYLARCPRAAPPEESQPTAPDKSDVPATIDMQQPDGLEIPDVEAVELPPAREHHWHWSRRSSDPAARAVAFLWNSDETDKAFEEHVSELASCTSMDIASLRHALEYYDSMTPLQRAMIPREPIGHRDWRKIKRGKHRILIREEEGRRLFHVYDRKAWVSRGRIR